MTQPVGNLNDEPQKHRSVLHKHKAEMFQAVIITIAFRDKLLAGIPKNEDMLAYFCKKRGMSDKEREDLINRCKLGTLTETEQEEAKSLGVRIFERDRQGNCCLWHGNFKAMIREILTTWGMTQRRPNSGKPAKPKGKKSKKEQPLPEGVGLLETNGPNLVVDGIESNDDDGLIVGKNSSGGKQTFQHGLHIDGILPTDSVRLLIQRDGKFLTEPDGYLDRVSHVTDKAGKRSVLGRHDFFDQAEIGVIIKWPRKGVYSTIDIEQVLCAAEEDGLGAVRSQGYGKFDVIRCEEYKL